MYLNNIGNDIDALEMCMNVLYKLMLYFSNVFEENWEIYREYI